MICFLERIIILILGTRRGGLAVYGKNGFDRAIHNIENSPFRTKFEKEANEMKGIYGNRLHF